MTAAEAKPAPRIDVLVSVTLDEAAGVRGSFPQFRLHYPLTPRTLGSLKRLADDLRINSWIWTPTAVRLPARVRMAVRGALAPHVDELSVEEVWPLDLLSW